MNNDNKKENTWVLVGTFLAHDGRFPFLFTYRTVVVVVVVVVVVYDAVVHVIVVVEGRSRHPGHSGRSPRGPCFFDTDFEATDGKCSSHCVF